MRGPRCLAAAMALVALAMSGCASADETTAGSGSAATTSASPSPTAVVTVQKPPPQPPQEQTIRVTISGGKVDPPPGRVQIDKGKAVRLIVSSDQADEVHVHGYDLEAPVGPGAPATITFTAGQTGLFEVETHDSEQVLLQLQVT
jgi:hypothetical protein